MRLWNPQKDQNHLIPARHFLLLLFFKISQRKFQNFGTGWAKKQAGSSRIMEMTFLKGFEKCLSPKVLFTYIRHSTMVAGSPSEPASVPSSSHVNETLGLSSTLFEGPIRNVVVCLYLKSKNWNSKVVPRYFFLILKKGGNFRS